MLLGIASSSSIMKCATNKPMSASLFFPLQRILGFYLSDAFVGDLWPTHTSARLNESTLTRTKVLNKLSLWR